jgi:hypothetical protein
LIRSHVETECFATSMAHEFDIKSVLTPTEQGASNATGLTPTVPGTSATISTIAGESSGLTSIVPPLPKRACTTAAVAAEVGEDEVEEVLYTGAEMFDIAPGSPSAHSRSKSSSSSHDVQGKRLKMEAAEADAKLAR